jgi:hypothetical protein
MSEAYARSDMETGSGASGSGTNASDTTGMSGPATAGGQPEAGQPTNDNIWRPAANDDNPKSAGDKAAQESTGRAASFTPVAGEAGPAKPADGTASESAASQTTTADNSSTGGDIRKFKDIELAPEFKKAADKPPPEPDKAAGKKPGGGKGGGGDDGEGGEGGRGEGGTPAATLEPTWAEIMGQGQAESDTEQKGQEQQTKNHDQEALRREQINQETRKQDSQPGSLKL